MPSPALALIAAFLIVASVPAWAGDPVRERSDAWAASVAAFEILDDDPQGMLELEYRWGWHPSFPWGFPELAPFGGLFVVDESSLYLYGGIRYDLDLSDRWRLTPSWGPGLFEAGSGTDLGSALEFRSKLELSYKIHPRARLALSFAHLSNGGLDERNPGSDVLALTCIWSGTKNF